jgi:hypothetical protein
MAFTPETLCVIAQPIGGVGMRMVSYRSDDSEATITGAGYFVAATGFGLRRGDILFVSPITGPVDTYVVIINSVDADGNATGVVAELTDAMAKLVYDPQSIAADVFDRANHTGTQAHTTITGLGGAATLNVGTGAGTVAAGNDGRITGAIQTASRAATSVIGRSANTSGDAADIAATTNDRFLARVSDALSWVQLTIGMIPDALITYAKMAAGALASFAEYNSATASRILTNASVWGDLAVLTDGATIAVDLNAGYDFGQASNAPLALGDNRELGAPSNVRTGKKGILWFTATGSTRTLTLNAAWVMAIGVETGPYSIATTQTLGVAYVCRGTTVIVTGIVRTG